MPGFAVRDHLVYPAAVVLALGAVTVAQPNSTASAPRFAEVSAIRLQAEITNYVGGLADATVTGLASAPQAAASAAPAAATASALGAPWPSTFLDKLIAGLPPQIQSIVLPPLYVVAMVVGAIMGVFYTIFGWPKELMPAAAVAPEPTRAPAASVALKESVSSATSSTPGLVPTADRNTDHAAADDGGAPAQAGAASAGHTRGRHPAPVAETHEATASGADGVVGPKSVAPKVFPAASATGGGPAPVVGGVAQPAVTAETTPADDAPAEVNHPAPARGRSSDGESANSPARGAKRSVR